MVVVHSRASVTYFRGSDLRLKEVEDLTQCSTKVLETLVSCGAGILPA
ncbi:MAG: hypothetical protein HC879_11240 [Leptolyngbyaceae cyanobacterium SL_5_9]|nr:hypothetical protein [Leptolyngbyaceae cyanobacterium SL_5_9]